MRMADLQPNRLVITPNKNGPSTLFETQIDCQVGLKYFILCLQSTSIVKDTKRLKLNMGKLHHVDNKQESSCNCTISTQQKF